MKVQDARAHMRHEFIGEHDAAAPKPPRPATQNQCSPAMKNSSAPDQRDQHGLAEIGLQNQRHDRRRQQQQRQQLPGTSRRRAPSEIAQAARMTKAGLQEFRRLDAENPAPRALDLMAEEQRREDQRHRGEIDEQRRAPHMARRQEGQAEHQRERGDEKLGLPVDEMEGRQMQAVGDRRAAAHDQHQAQHDERPEAASSQRSTVHHQSATANVPRERPS